LPIRWTVERTFAWLNQCRRLTVDREKSTRSAVDGPPPARGYDLNG
jgi:transposase